MASDCFEMSRPYESSRSDCCRMLNDAEGDDQTSSPTVPAAASDDLPPELDSDDMDAVLEVLRGTVGDAVGGLESPSRGQSYPGKSVPAFGAVGLRRFVQICDAGDYWVCATNVFSQCLHDVFVYDSLCSTLTHSLVVQISSLLRAEDVPQSINFHLRFFEQRPCARLCGYYAVAACISCVLHVDPTGYFYDETQLLLFFKDLVRNGNVRLFPAVRLPVVGSWVVERRAKLHCLCQRPEDVSPEMIQCSRCLYWFHLDVCVARPSASPAAIEKMDWLGPCCA